MDRLGHDLRYGLRVLAKSPAFTLLAIATLALGMGANTAIFSVANTLLLRALPFENPKQLVFISTDPNDTCCVSLPYLTQIQQTNTSFSDVAAYQDDAVNMALRGGAEQVGAERVTWNFFRLVGAKPIAGRTFTEAEDQDGGDVSVMIGDSLALRLFGSAQGAIGQHLGLDSRDYAVVGVLPAKFGLPLMGREPDVWMTRLNKFSATTPARVNAGGQYYYLLGRLRPSVTAARARVEAEVIFQQYKRDKPGNFDATSDVTITAGELRPDYDANLRPTILILSAAVACLLLIACANTASLLLSRALGRRREFAVRSAMGAPRWSVIRLVLGESLMMAVASGVWGVGFGYVGTRLLSNSMQKNLPQVATVSVDFRVLGFALGVSLLCGILFGLAPALQLARPDLATILCEEGRGAAGSRTKNRLRGLILTMQVALSMVLLIGAGLLIRSFERLEKVSPGFDATNVLTARTFLPVTTYPRASDRITFYRAALQRLQAMPGVTAAALSTALPVLENHLTPVRFEGQRDAELGQRPIVLIESISPDYGKALGVPLLAGRPFNDFDDAQSAPVVMVNAAAARKYWPNENAVGKRVWVGTQPPASVVGVLGDLKNQSMADAPQPEVFLSYPQFASATLYLSVRTVAEPHGFASAVRTQILAVNPDQPITDVQTMDERLATSNAQARALTALVGVFSAAAMILAVVGIYGAIAYSVEQRTQELGVRMALGASRAEVLRLVIGDGLRLALLGIAIGVAASFALTRLMTSVLYATSTTDPLTMAGSAVLFVAATVLASYLPARRAMKIHPSEALRST
jgi:putative ABC transport system permease protein